MLHPFCLDEIAATPWKNGGGLTREIASGSALPGSTAGSTGDFDWRVSVATIEGDGPFSRFEGIDRTIMLLTGPGVRLSAPDFEHDLAQPLRPFEFAGEEAVHCTMLGGASTDFNLMVRRGCGTGMVTVHREPVRIEAAGGVMLAVGGTAEVLDLVNRTNHRISAGCGAWWNEPLTQELSPARGSGVVVAQWSPA